MLFQPKLCTACDVVAVTAAVQRADVYLNSVNRTPCTVASVHIYLGAGAKCYLY